MTQTFKIDNTDKLLSTTIDYLFWSILIFYTNPGGIFQALNVWYVAGRFNINDILFICLSLCYLIIPKTYNSLDLSFNRVRNYLLLFLIYYLIIFGFIVPLMNGNKDYSLASALFKLRWTIYSVFLFIYLYEFFKRRYDIFIKIFFYSSICILFIFLLQLLIHINILPTDVLNREFVNIDRNMMFSYGLMPLIIPFGVITIIFKPTIDFKYLVITGFVLMSLVWMVSLTRRHIFGIFIYFLIAIFIYNYFTGRIKVLFNSTIKAVTILTFIIICLYFISPKYVDAARIGIVESINVVLSQETSKGSKDERLNLQRPFIVERFLEHPFFGTGFDNRWRTMEGDNQGYEASDYPFLAALAMFGVAGLVVFMPVYLFLIKCLKNDLQYLKNIKNNDKSLQVLFLLTFILYFIFHLLQYFNYFLPISNPNQYIWYAALALYYGSRHRFYASQIHTIIPSNNTSLQNKI